MPNIKSAKKRVVTSAKRAERNKAVKSELKTTIKKFDAAIAENDKAVVDTAFREAVKMVDRPPRRALSKRTPLRERNPSSRSRSTRPARNIPRIQSESGSRRALLFCPDFTGGRQAPEEAGRAGQGYGSRRGAQPVAAAGPPEEEAGTAGRRGRARRLREGTTEAGPLAGRAKKHMENKRRAGTLMYRPSRFILALSGQ